MINFLTNFAETDDYVAFTADCQTKETVQEKKIGRIEPGETSTPSFYLHAVRTPGVRLITLTVRNMKKKVGIAKHALLTIGSISSCSQPRFSGNDGEIGNTSRTVCGAV